MRIKSRWFKEGREHTPQEVSDALAFVLWTYVIDRLPAGIAGLGTLAVPVIGMTTSRIHLHEDVGFWEGWGIALIVAALTLLSLIRLREQRRDAVVPGQD